MVSSKASVLKCLCVWLWAHDVVVELRCATMVFGTAYTSHCWLMRVWSIYRCRHALALARARSCSWQVCPQPSQATNVWQVSARENGPSARPLSGIWWANEYKVTKVLYANWSDGTRKALGKSGVLCRLSCAVLVFVVLVFCVRLCVFVVTHALLV